MERIVYTHAQQNPTATAVMDGDISLTYSELLCESIDLAQDLKANMRIALEEPIAILLGPGFKQIIAQLAVRLAGGTCVPIEPGLPTLRITAMLEDIHVKHVILDRADQMLLPDLVHIYVGTPRKNQTSLPTWEFGPESDRSHILFTSGSTGKPKPVQIRAASVLHLARRTPVTPLLSTERVAEFNNPGFDLSLFEIWVTLVSGATIVVIPRQVATDPGTLPAFLKEQRVTVIIITASLLEIMAFACPSMFSALRHVLTAGDVANVKAVRSILEKGAPDNLWNTYGPTECTTLTTMLKITPEEANQDRISIGRPVGDMEVFLLDEGQRLIFDHNKRGEIYIAGPQLSSGYFDRPLENEMHYVSMARKNLYDQGGNEIVRLYRTGDLAEWIPNSDCLDFRGRSDTQVKHGGFRVELEEVERVLLSHEAIQSAVVVRQPPKTAGGTHALVGFIAMKDGTLDIDTVLGFVRERLPPYMIPNALEALMEFPLTANGKVDRNALLERRVSALEGLKLPLPDGSEATKDNKIIIKDLWKKLLNLPSVGDYDDFFALGATSLQAAALIALIQDRLGRLVAMEDLYRYSRLQELAQHVGPTKPPVHRNAPDDTSIWIQDIDLVNDIELTPEWEAADEGRVFVTGVTGFVGAHLLHHLLHRVSIKRIACLVRPQSGQGIALRVRRELEKYDLWPASEACLQKLLLLDGDLADSTLGLGASKFSWLAGWTSVIFHLGAKVNFCEAYREHYRANVVGTCNVLRLAATGRRKAFHYMSSVDAWGPTGCILGTSELFEDGPLQPHIQGLRYDLGYAQSQWTAEAMVRRMRDRGLPIAIYRPGFIIGDSKTGASNPNDFFTRFVVGCIQLGKYPKLTQCLEYITVDYVISAMMHIASSNNNLGRSYHLLSPNPKDSVTIEGTWRVINEAGYPVEMVDYEDWASLVIEKQRENAPLAPLHPMVQERVLGRLTRWEASQYTPWYRADNTVEALRDRPDIQYHALDVPMLKRFIAFWNRKGFYEVKG